MGSTCTAPRPALRKARSARRIARTRTQYQAMPSPSHQRPRGWLKPTLMTDSLKDHVRSRIARIHARRPLPTAPRGDREDHPCRAGGWRPRGCGVRRWASVPPTSPSHVSLLWPASSFVGVPHPAPERKVSHGTGVQLANRSVHVVLVSENRPKRQFAAIFDINSASPARRTLACKTT